MVKWPILSLLLISNTVLCEEATGEEEVPHYDEEPDAPSVPGNDSGLHFDREELFSLVTTTGTSKLLPESPETGTSKKLTEFLIARHNPAAPPDGVLDVHYEMELVHILGIDELKQTMTVLVYIDERWTDPSLSWDPALFGGIPKTWLPLNKIWVPDVIVFNMLDHEDLLSAVRAPALIFSNGTIETSHPAVHTVSCKINIKHFPLDDQRCSMEIASWQYGKEKIKLTAPPVRPIREHYTDNEEWQLLSVRVNNSDYHHEGIVVSELRYEVSVKRRPLFYMVTLTFPSYVMCAISVVGLFARFSTTGEREERFTLGVTAILTMAVLSLVVSEKIPHSSTHVPLLVGYFLFNMVTVSLAAMTTGIVMKVHRMGRYGDEPSYWILCIFCLRYLRKRRQVTEAVTKEDIPETVTLLNGEVPNGNGNRDLPNGNENGNGNIDQQLTKKIVAIESFVKKLAATCENIQGELNDFDLDDPHALRRKKESNGYVRIAERLDVIFMTFFLVLVTVPVLILFSLS